MIATLIWADVWAAVAALASVATAIAAFWAVCLVGPQLRHNTRALQLQAFDSIFKDIRQLDSIWIEKNFDHGMTKEERQAWCASFFNTIEYLCFLMNHEMVRPEELHKFFDAAIPEWRDQFRKYRSLGLINDTPTSFTEFRQICTHLKLDGAGADPL